MYMMGLMLGLGIKIRYFMLLGIWKEVQSWRDLRRQQPVSAGQLQMQETSAPQESCVGDGEWQYLRRWVSTYNIIIYRD